jgi:hypothetical protein
MVPATALVPIVLGLALGVEASLGNRRSWGRPFRREVEARGTEGAQREQGDYQTFNEGIAQVYAPAVTTSNGKWYQSGQQYETIYDALVNSCYQQAMNCHAAAGENREACWGSVSRIHIA